MFDEYIINKLEELHKEKEELTQQLLSLTEEETRASQQIEKLLEQEDVGMELFSPRAERRPLKIQVEEIKSQIEEIKDKEALVNDKLEVNSENEQKYREFLQEAKNNAHRENDTETQPESAAVIRDLTKWKTELNRELDVLLKRIDKCINLVYSDRKTCKNELKNMRYYVMAMISKQDHEE